MTVVTADGRFCQVSLPGPCCQPLVPDRRLVSSPVLSCKRRSVLIAFIKRNSLLDSMLGRSDPCGAWLVGGSWARQLHRAEPRVRLLRCLGSSCAALPTS